MSDLVAAHSDALAYLRRGGASTTLNCGYGRGFSVLDVIETVKRVSGVDFKVELAGRRAGDPAQIVAACDRIRSTLGWQPQFDDLRDHRRARAGMGAHAAAARRLSYQFLRSQTGGVPPPIRHQFNAQVAEHRFGRGRSDRAKPWAKSRRSVGIDADAARRNDMISDIPKLDPREQRFPIPGPHPPLKLFVRHLPALHRADAEPRPVLYVHGATFPSALSIAHRFDGFSWRDALNEAGFDVWALDFQGFGGSDRYGEMGQPAKDHAPLCDAQDAGRQVEAAARFILKHQDVPRLSLVSHSWGSMPAGVLPESIRP